MVEFNTFTGRGLIELPFGLMAYLLPSYLPIMGLDLENPATLFIVKWYGIALTALCLLSIYTGQLDPKSPLRRQVAIVLMGYSSMMITLLVNSPPMFTLKFMRHVSPEVTIGLVHGMFCWEFYQLIQGETVTSSTPGVIID